MAINAFAYSLWGTDPLYWMNLPFILIVNDFFFPDWKSVLYASRESTNIPIWSVVEEAKKLGKVDLHVHDERVRTNGDRGLLLLRMKPLWSEEYRYVFPRDLDSIPTSWELRAVKVFVESGLSVHMLRGNLHHDTLMGGLCGFKREEAVKMLGGTFHEYEAKCADKDGLHPRGTPQYKTSQMVVNGDMKHVLESPFGTSADLEWCKAARIPFEVYDKVDLSFAGDLVSLMDRDGRFPGAVVLVSREAMEKAIALNTDLAKAFSSSMGTKLEQFLESLEWQRRSLA